MDKAEVEKVSTAPDDCSQLSRNRSFKSKQLVRSQAIRESHSPPRTISPYPVSPVNEPKTNETKPSEKENGDNGPDPPEERKQEEKKQPVEIQITSGGWDGDGGSEQRQRTRRWLGNRHRSDSRSLLSHSPRLACVCGACDCASCRGQRTKLDCPVKQDSGIACSVEYPDCDFERLSANGDGVRKSGSFEDQSLYGRGSDRRDRQRNFSFTRSDSDIAEPSWPELVAFIKTTLNKNARDRETLLRVEKDLHAFVNDPGRCVVRFPTMTSYGRMLVHRCAALFQLAHRMDLHHRNTVLVSKGGTSGGRIPCTSFAQWCTVSFPKSPARQDDDTAAKSILKRSGRGEGGEGGAGGGGEGGAASRSLEQREREYERVRRRIFTTDNGGQDSEWPWLPTGPVKLLTPEPGRNKLIKVQSLESRGATESNAGPRGPVAKSHSLDGYGAETPQARLLSRQGDLASSSWRVSSCSSGYKTLSLRSTDSVTPSPTGFPSPESTARSSTPAAEAAGAAASVGHAAPARAVVWAVTDMAAVPTGALVIHPQTGRPLTNPDGSVYHFDPANPPVIQDDDVYLQNGVQDANADKRRGRLEKQHSFVENECDYPQEQCEVKCNCDCNEQESAKCAMEQLTLSPRSSKANSAPNSPKRPEPVTLTNNSSESTNQRPAYDNPANQRTLYDTATNQRVPYDNPANQRPEPTNQYSPSRARRNYNPLQRYDQRYVNLKYEQTQNQVIEVSARIGLDATNQRTPVEVSTNRQEVANRMPEVSANQRVGVDAAANQRAFESQRFEIQRPPSYDQGQRSAVHTSEAATYVQNYVQYRSDEITSPPQPPSQYPPEMADMQAMIAHKMASMSMPDPNIRPMSIAANMMYPAAIHQGYQYVNPCRLDQGLQPVYQPLLQPQEEHKHMPQEPHVQHAHHTDSTFRIDPSYPYATDFAAACGACADPAAVHHQRSVSVAYGQMEMPQAVLPQPYPVHNVIPQIPPYPYQEAVAWGGVSLLGGPGVPSGPSGPGGSSGPTHKLLVPDVYPVVCPAIYPPCGVIYPQVIPQPYQICPPVYPVIDKQPEVYQQRVYNQRQSKRNSVSGSSRTTPQTPDDKKTDAAMNNRAMDVTREVDSNQASDQSANKSCNRSTDESSREIADTIAQIKEQLALNKERERERERGGRGREEWERGGRGREEWHRRNSGGGILGSYPMNSFNGRVVGRPANEESQINPAIYNSIRNFQAKQNYQQQDRRAYELASNRHDGRHDGRRRAERDDRAAGGWRPDALRPRAVNVPFQLRPPYLFRQMTPNTWSRRSPGMIPPVMNHPRRPHPERNPRR